MSSIPGRPGTRSDYRNVKAAQRATPWRTQNIVGTKRSTECAEYIAQRRKAGEVPRPLTELDK